MTLTLRNSIGVVMAVVPLTFVLQLPGCTQPEPATTGAIAGEPTEVRVDRRSRSESGGTSGASELISAMGRRRNVPRNWPTASSPWVLVGCWTPAPAWAPLDWRQPGRTGSGSFSARAPRTSAPFDETCRPSTRNGLSQRKWWCNRRDRVVRASPPAEARVGQGPSQRTKPRCSDAMLSPRCSSDHAPAASAPASAIGLPAL